MKRTLFSLLFLFIILGACQEEEATPFPSLITTFADVKSNKEGTLFCFITDKEETFRISNTQSGYRPDTTYRAVCGYVPQGEEATVYQLQGVRVLKDSTNIAKQHPIDILSAWRTFRYINMQLSPRTQGGTQYWGYCIDSIHPGHCYIRLHHNQNQDALSYNETLYASISLAQVSNLQPTDTIHLSIHTFKGLKQWTMAPVAK